METQHMTRFVTKPDNMGDRADFGNSPTGRLLSVGRDGVGWQHTLIAEEDRLPLAQAIAGDEYVLVKRT